MSWRIRTAPWARPFIGDAPALGRLLLAATRHPDQRLRDDARSRVLLLREAPAGTPPELIHAAPAPWVLKRPLWRDGRAWNRLVSLFQPGEMCRAFRAGLLLLESGVATPRPLLLLERRRWGLLVESWLVYEYVEGGPVTERQWPRVVEILSHLHAAGLCHRDPHLANWLVATDGQVVALDPGPRRLRPLLADDAYDFVLLRNCRPEILPLLPLQGSWKWRVAEARNAAVQGWRRWKRRLRGRR
ncbi:MAG: hypothetical protein WC326_09300 [Candidatus Delongbacteria bacterium]